MSIKSDKWIKRMSTNEGMIKPFVESNIRKDVVSYGLSSYGYDIRVSDEYKIFTNINNSIIDPKKFDDKSFISFKGDVCVVPANSFDLARCLEYFKIPRIETVRIGLEKFNAKIKIQENSIFLDSSSPVFSEKSIDTFCDHRIALAFSPLVLKTNKLTINNPQVIDKSYPAFWNQLKKMGIKVFFQK